MARCKFIVMTPMGRVFSRHDVSTKGFKAAVASANKESVDSRREVDINLDCGGSPGMRHSGIFVLTCDGNTCDTRYAGKPDAEASSIRISGRKRRR